MAVRMDMRDRSGVEIEGVEAERPRVPEWLGEAILLGQYWLESGLVGYLEEEVRVVRGRMGRYEVVDFVLLLLSYAVSGEQTLREFYKGLAPVKEVLMGVWGRLQCPSASNLSRFLAAVDKEAVGRLRELFEADLGRNGVGVIQGIGIFDRVKEHYLVFDVDGTVSAVVKFRVFCNWFRAICNPKEEDKRVVRRGLEGSSTESEGGFEVNAGSFW